MILRVANMGSSCSYSLLLPLLLLGYFLISASTAQAQTPSLQKGAASNNSVSAIFVFGDSTVDPGNNNHISTVVKSNFPPYGRDFADQIPTGRFTNGRLVTDFIGSYVGIKEYLPPYLDKSLSMEELMTGVSFASAGSGYDPLTAELSGVIPIKKQLDYFREYKARIEFTIGKRRTGDLIKKALFVISAGTNDFIANYFLVPTRRQSYTVANYQQFLLQIVQQLIQDLRDLGARKIAVVGLPPMGCIPVVITGYSRNAFLQRQCIEAFSSLARDYNQKLQNELVAVQTRLATDGGTIVYVNIYRPLLDMVENPSKFGFEEWRSGCCGTGLMEASIWCNPKSLVCLDSSKYVFWDSVHPTEKAYRIVFNDVRPIVDRILKV